MSQATGIDIGIRKLSDTDSKLARIIRQIGPCLLIRREQGFPALAYSIIGQQLSKTAAASICSRLDSAFMSLHLNPVELVNMDDNILRQTGLSLPKVHYLKGLADYVISGKIDFNDLEDRSNEEIINKLTEIRGIGRWTAEMYLMFSMNRLDVFPVGDKAIRSAINQIYDVPKNSSDDTYMQIANGWTPYRTIASWYLYKYLEYVCINKS
jgi:DNA-3-methyladenine glycosylase II